MIPNGFALAAAILAVGFFLVAAFDGWPFGPLWSAEPILRFAVFAAAGGLAVLIVAFIDHVRS